MAIGTRNGNDGGLQYLHPSITSNINSNQIDFTPSNNTTSFFFAIISEKGEDNKVNLTTSADEFIFKYGQPNLRKYGQGSYNIINLLNTGAEVYVLRVLPENAGYAHAFLNIQTKVSKKKVKDYNGQVVTYRDVNLRPCVSNSTHNNISEKKLLNELTVNRNDISIDGYTNNLLFAIYPYGRGSSYNKLGFRITLNTSYDEMYSFRVYNFEIISFDEYNVANIEEGPFYVSFEPEAVSSSNESMFIEDVINKYSKIVKCKFNERAYDNLCNIINPSARPEQIDILSGQTRLKAGQPETFFCEETKNYEDIHLSLHKYDINGNPILENGFKVLNIVSFDDKMEETAIAIDNSMRENMYEDSTEMVDGMKKSLSSLIQKTYKSEIQSIVLSQLEHDVMTLKSGTYKTAIDNLTSAYNTAKELIFAGDLPTEGVVTELTPEGLFTEGKLCDHQTLETLKTKNDLMSNYIDEVILQMKKVLPLFKIFKHIKGNQFNVPLIEDSMNRFIRMLNGKESINFKILSSKDRIAEITKKLIFASTIVDTDEAIESLFAIFTDSNNQYPVLREVVKTLSPIISCYYKADGHGATVRVEPYTEMINKIDKIKDALIEISNILGNEYIDSDLKKKLIKGTGEDQEVLVNRGFEKLLSDMLSIMTDTLTSLYVFSNYSVNFEIVYGTDSLISTDLTIHKVAKASYDCCEEYDNIIISGNADDKDHLFNKVRTAISDEIQKVSAKSTSVIVNHLQNLQGALKLDKGTDGDLELSNGFDGINNSARETVKTQLLSKAYRGLIDPNVTNKKQLPFKYLLDANYPLEVKQAMVSLASEIRKDLFVWIDTEFCSSPAQALEWRMNKFPISTKHAGIFTQDFLVYDDNTGKDIKVTLSYFLSKMIPNCATQYGLHFPIAGPRRGIVDGYKENSISFIPNELYKEQLYTKQINYVETDTRRTKIGSQLTSDTKNTALSNINNVLTVLDIQRDTEYMSEMYQFEFNDNDTISSFQSELNQYLTKYTSNRSCEEVKATVYSSDYDKQQKILRVKLEIKFNNVIERIVIDINVVK